MVFLINKCEKCMGFMKVEKIGDEYWLICPNCDKEKEENIND